MRPADYSHSLSARSPAHTHTVAIIPARYASTRLPGKALADLAGRPMIEHVYRRATSCRAIGAVLVATDDRRIAETVERFGGVARMTRATHPSATDRVAEVAADLDCDLVVNLQGDEPLLEPDAIEAALRPFASDPSLQMATLCCPFSNPADARDPNTVKVVIDLNGFALYFSRAPIPFVRDSGSLEPHSGPFKHIGLYVYRREFLLRLASLPPTPLERCESLEQLRALEHGFAIRTVETRHDSVGVDTPEDLERVRRLLAAEARA